MITKRWIPICRAYALWWLHGLKFCLEIPSHFWANGKKLQGLLFCHTRYTALKLKLYGRAWCSAWSNVCLWSVCAVASAAWLSTDSELDHFTHSDDHSATASRWWWHRRVWLINLIIHWFINSVIDWLIHWSIDWFIHSFSAQAMISSYLPFLCLFVVCSQWAGSKICHYHDWHIQFPCIYCKQELHGLQMVNTGVKACVLKYYVMHVNSACVLPKYYFI